MTGFRFYFTPLAGVLFTFHSRYSALSVMEEYLALGGGPPRFKPGSTCLALLGNNSRVLNPFAYGAFTLYGRPFHAVQLEQGFVTPRQPITTDLSLPQPRTHIGVMTVRNARFGLIPVRSPLLGKSRFLSSPSGT